MNEIKKDDMELWRCPSCCWRGVLSKVAIDLYDGMKMCPRCWRNGSMVKVELLLPEAS